MILDWQNHVLRGRDCPFPSGLRNSVDGRSASNDAIAINSTGIAALTFAARCASANAFGGGVHVFGSPVQESRRLVNGVTLRARTLDYYAASTGAAPEEILERLYRCDWRLAATHDQRASHCIGNAKKGFRFANVTTWMRNDKPRRNRTMGLPLAFGIRNSRLNRVLQDLAVEAGVTLHDARGLSAGEMRSQVKSDSLLLVNGTPAPMKDAPITHPAPPPARFVAAVQMPFSSPRLAARGVIEPHSGFIAFVHRDGAIDMGVYNPFRDDLSPEATFYGIFFRVVAGPEGLDKERELSTLRDTVLGVGDALGLEPVDPEETEGTACVPVSPWSGLANRQDGVLDLSWLSGAGAPIITGDGMTRAAVAGYVAAEAVVEGRDPVADVNLALAYYRQINWELHLMMTRLAAIAAPAVRYFPRLFLWRNSRTYERDMWAGCH